MLNYFERLGIPPPPWKNEIGYPPIWSNKTAFIPGRFSLKSGQIIKKSMKNFIEITYFSANCLILAKNEQQNEINAWIPAKNQPE